MKKTRKKPNKTNRQIVTFTTDFGWYDHYLPQIKGTMLCQFEDLNIIDITHGIKNYDIVQAAFLFRNAWQHFPAGSIHLVSVNNFDEGRQEFIAISYQGHYFIGPDNGIFSLVFDDPPGEVYRLPFPEEKSFPLKDIFASAVHHIASGNPITEIGNPAQEIVQRLAFQPVISHSQIRGAVIHIDNFENVIINISHKLFEEVGQDRAFSLFFKRNDPISKLSKHYHDVPIGEPLCRVNSSGYLEIAINMGKAGSLLGLKIEDTVQIDFHSLPTEEETE